MFPIRDDQPRYSTPFVNGFLIVLNILVYLFQASLDPRSAELFARQFGVVPSHLSSFLAGSPKYPLAAIVIPFFTSMFLHAGWMHVVPLHLWGQH
jgi:membrane associated rhomboid family serine protease